MAKRNTFILIMFWIFLVFIGFIYLMKVHYIRFERFSTLKKYTYMVKVFNEFYDIRHPSDDHAATTSPEFDRKYDEMRQALKSVRNKYVNRVPPLTICVLTLTLLTGFLYIFSGYFTFKRSGKATGALNLAVLGYVGVIVLSLYNAYLKQAAFQSLTQKYLELYIAANPGAEKIMNNHPSIWNSLMITDPLFIKAIVIGLCIFIVFPIFIIHRPWIKSELK